MTSKASRIQWLCGLFCLLGLTLRADMGWYDSVEWETSLADYVGVYKATQIRGPHKVATDAQHWGWPYCTADFKLEQPLRGSPPTTFSRTRSGDKPELLGFKAGDTYVFFFVAEGRLTNVHFTAKSTAEAFFSMWDYVWLERPPGERNGVAINYQGKVLTERGEVLKVIQAALKLPRAHPEIDRGAYFSDMTKSPYPHAKEFNYRMIDFPTAATSALEREAWAGRNSSWTGLVIPSAPVEAPSSAPPTGQTYRNTNYGFQFTVPAGWAVRETGFYVAHYSLVFLAVNSQRPGLEIRDWPIGTNSMGFGAGTTFQQMQPGEVHVSFGYSGGPGPEIMSADTQGTNLHSLLAGKGIAASGQAGLSCLNLGFLKRGHRWDISAYLREPVTEENRGKVMSTLQSFEFLDAPVGNAGWAESLACEALPESIRVPEDWRGWPVASSAGEEPASAQLGAKSVVVKKVGADYSVRFVWDAVGVWEYAVSANGKVTQPQPAVTYPVSVGSSRLPSGLPGQAQGRNDCRWLAPCVQAARVLGKTTVTWFAQDGSVTRQAADAEDLGPGRGFVSVAGPSHALEGINEDWRIVPHPPAPGPISGHIACTPDSRVFLDQFSPKPELVALDIYIHGKRVNTVGPFIPCYPSTDAVLNDDGSAALLVWKDQGKTNAQIVVLNTNGQVQFHADCGQLVHSPIVAPNGAGVLLLPNTGGADRNTFMWFTRRGKERALDLSPNPEFTGWIPGSRQSLFWTSLGNESRQWHLIDWDAGKRLWDIPSPGTGQPLAAGLTPTLVIFAMAEPYGSPLTTTGTAQIRTFFAVKVEDGSLAARWQAPLPHRALDAGTEHFLHLGTKLFYVTPEEFTEISLEDILSKGHGWK